MSDVIVTVPANFTHPRSPGLRGLAAWIGEGDAAGDGLSFTEWTFWLGPNRPRIEEGERVYIVCEGKLRGYAPLIRVDRELIGETGLRMRYGLTRIGDAVAVTVRERTGAPRNFRGFQGFRYRWWDRSEESPFPEWRTP